MMRYIGPPTRVSDNTALTETAKYDINQSGLSGLIVLVTSEEKLLSSDEQLRKRTDELMYLNIRRIKYNGVSVNGRELQLMKSLSCNFLELANVELQDMKGGFARVEKILFTGKVQIKNLEGIEEHFATKIKIYTDCSHLFHPRLNITLLSFEQERLLPIVASFTTAAICKMLSLADYMKTLKLVKYGMQSGEGTIFAKLLPVSSNYGHNLVFEEKDARKRDYSLPLLLNKKSPHYRFRLEFKTVRNVQDIARLFSSSQNVNWKLIPGYVTAGNLGFTGVRTTFELDK